MRAAGPLAMLTLAAALAQIPTAAQSSAAPVSPGTVIPLSLPRPEYPPSLASAGVTGEIVVRLSVGPDGSVLDAIPIRGPGSLRAAAVPAAGMSTFECRGCGPGAHDYTVVYVFELRSTMPRRQPNPIVEHGQARVTVVAQGRAVWPDDMPMEAVRAGRCLWLWRCGLRPFDRNRSLPVDRR